MFNLSHDRGDLRIFLESSEYAWPKKKLEISNSYGYISEIKCYLLLSNFKMISESYLQRMIL